MSTKHPNKVAHVVSVDMPNELANLLCLHCGKVQNYKDTLTLADLPDAYKRALAFNKKHRTCRDRKPQIAAIYKDAL